MLRIRHPFVVTAALLFMLVALTGAAGHFDDCGECLDYNPTLCEVVEMEHPCHAWEDQHDGPAPRCENPHTYAGEDLYLGLGTCSAEHPAPCWLPDCPTSEDQDKNLDENLAAAVSALDLAALEDLMATAPQAWVEVNEDRMALQIFARCVENPAGGVVLHIPVTNEGVFFWASALSTSEISDRPEIGGGTTF